MRLLETYVPIISSARALNVQVCLLIGGKLACHSKFVGSGAMVVELFHDRGWCGNLCFSLAFRLLTLEVLPHSGHVAHH